MNKKIFFSICLLALTMTLQARPRTNYTTVKGLRHYLTFSLQAGEANSIVRSDIYDLQGKIGADAAFDFGYEIRKKHFFLNLGVMAQYTLTRTGVGDFTDAFPRLDREGDAMIYGYHYSDYVEQQHILTVGVPVRVGYYFTPQFYGSVGVKAGFPLVADYRTTTTLMTDGTYDQYFEPLQDDPSYGYYSPDQYSYGRGLSSSPLMISPMLELGGLIPVSKSNHALRVGGYIEYAIPVGVKRPYATLADYSAVDANPYTQNQEDLARNLVLNSTLEQTSDNVFSRFSFGVRVTVVVDVTGRRKCVTCIDDSGIDYRYRAPKNLRRTK